MGKKTSLYNINVGLLGRQDFAKLTSVFFLLGKLTCFRNGFTTKKPKRLFFSFPPARMCHYTQNNTMSLISCDQYSLLFCLRMTDWHKIIERNYQENLQLKITAESAYRGCVHLLKISSTLSLMPWRIKFCKDSFHCIRM